jgi:predicted Na+-dependent transporter
VEEQNVAVQYFLPFTVAMIMLAMGLGLVPADFRRILDKPRAVVVGLGAQLILLPALGFAVAFGFGLGPELVRLATMVFATGGEVPELPILVGSIARQSENVLEFARQAGIPVLLLNVVAMLVGNGNGIAHAARLSRPQRRTITLEVGIQNGTLAFALAAGLLESVLVAIPAILYSILVYFTGTAVIADGRIRP